jgi:hypothetical protein
MLQLAELPVLAYTVRTRRQSRRVRGERELLAAIGNPLLAARLAWLCRRLARCAAVPVATVFKHR